MRPAAFRSLLVIGLTAACNGRPLSLDSGAEEPAGAAAGATAASPSAPFYRSGGSTPPASLPSSCDPVRQDCRAGQRCAPDCDRRLYACIPRGESHGTQGHVCAHEGDCLPGYACGTESRGSNYGTRCLRYCATDSDCPSGTRCARSSFVCDSSDPSRNVAQRICETGPRATDARANDI